MLNAAEQAAFVEANKGLAPTQIPWPGGYSLFDGEFSNASKCNAYIAARKAAGDTRVFSGEECVRDATEEVNSRRLIAAGVVGAGAVVAWLIFRK